MDLQKEVSNAIKQWQSENSRVRTLGFLSYKTGIAYSTLYRMKNKQFGHSFETTFEVIKYLYNSHEAMEFLMRHYPFMKGFCENDEWKSAC